MAQARQMWGREYGVACWGRLGKEGGEGHVQGVWHRQVCVCEMRCVCVKMGVFQTKTNV